MVTADYLRGLRRSWWIVVVAALLGAAAGGYLFWRATPLYAAQVQLIASTTTDPTSTEGGSDGSNGSADEAARGTSSYVAEQAKAFAQLAGTPPAVADAATEAGVPGATPAVSATASGTDPFLTITVTDTDPEVTRVVANAFAATLPVTSARLSGALPVAVGLKTLSPAALPEHPVSPALLRTVGLPLVVGVVVGVLLALLREYLNRTVRDADEIEQATGLPVLGVVPSELDGVRVPSLSHPYSARTEAYRQVRTAVLAMPEDQVPQVVAVTSAMTGEGKTSVATNLAVALARSGRRVVIVDADLRRPQVATAFDVAAEPGLTDVLLGHVTVDDVLREHADEPRLTLVTSGPIPTNPSEALGSDAMSAVLVDLRARFDVVVVDTPPVLPVADALTLAPSVDGVVLVCRLEVVSQDKIRRTAATLRRVGAPLLGAVANGAGRGRDRYYRYSYSYKGQEPSASVDVAAAARTASTLTATSAPTPTATTPNPTTPAVDATTPEPAVEPSTGRHSVPEGLDDTTPGATGPVTPGLASSRG
ncbi:polysaccharide biosynthesis tyrosine autokinase [Jatrophihabitans sp. YIM 134969]